MRRHTRQREAIQRAFAESARPLAPTEVLELARKHVETINLATVYRTITRLLDEGWIVQVDLPGEASRYEVTPESSRTHHHHFRCDKCDRVFDIPGCAGDLARMVPRGFTLRDHDLVLYGKCDRCSGNA